MIFHLKTLVLCTIFWGIEVSANKHDLLLTQSKYARDLISRAGLTDCKAVSTPMAVSEKLTKNVGDPLDNNTATKYRSLVGGLQYLTLVLILLLRSTKFVSIFTLPHPFTLPRLKEF